MKSKSFYCLALLVWFGVFFFTTIPAGAQVLDGVPHLINYQGRLTDGDGKPVSDGEYLVTFTIWSDPASTSPGDRKWISPNCPVTVTDGLFNWQLGSVENLPPWTVTNNVDLWLGIQIASDPEILPRVRLCSNPYAYKAWQSDYAEYADSAGSALSVADNSITDVKIASGADIDVTKIAGTAVNLNSSQTVNGAKTFSNLKVVTTTRRISIPYAAFNPSNNSTAFNKGNYFLYNGALGTNSVYYAPVVLPDSAVVTQLEGYFMDADDGNLSLVLRMMLYNAGYGDMASVASSGTSGAQTVTDNSIAHATVDNEHFLYQLKLEGSTVGPSLGNLGFVGAEIEYTITRPMP